MGDRVQEIFQEIANNNEVSLKQLRADMIVAIHAARTIADPQARQRFNDLFGGEEPSPEEFVAKIALQLKLV